jgi:3-oxoacyl-[acyl-carrier protein] reductase
MVSSVTGPVMATRADPVYAAAKAGMAGLVRALALDVAARGITVNAVAPGWIATGSQTPHECQQGCTYRLGVAPTRARSPPPGRFSPAPPRLASQANASWSTAETP